MPTDPEAKSAELAPSVARQLVQAAQRASNEAEFRGEVSRILESAGAAAGLTIVPREEFSVARGRVDSVYNRLILEYKRPGILRDSNDNRTNRDVIKQVKDYILDVGKRERREAARLAGVATDGFHFVFVRRVGEGWTVDDPVKVNAASTERFLRLLFSLSTGAALVPENLVDDFGPKHRRTQTAVRAIYRGLMTSKSPLVGKLFQQWRVFFAEATDYKEWSERIESKPEFQAFIKSLWTAEEIRHLDAARVFFVLHTYYALLIKLVASMAVGCFAGGASRPLSQIAALEGDDLRESFKDLEDGGIFKQYGIRNFLEGDFFGWYLAAWNEDIEEGVHSLVQRLAEYDPGALELAPENARDLLKKLYHYLLPREIRHDLGEYYTPDWLAERLIRQTLGLGGTKDPVVNPRTRVLDPACGSGTFLVILIKFMKRAVEKGRIGAREALGQILQNVVGFDLNPLAVIAARTNYLIALGDLVQARTGDIDIPVYQADSVLWPQREGGPEEKGQYSISYEGDVYRLRTAVGEFLVPTLFADRERMDLLANVLDDCVEANIGEGAFLGRLAESRELMPEEIDNCATHLRGLYKRLRDLHAQGLNGIWARIVKNQFAPVFLSLDPCQYVVGNPPWINWEHLPDEYRQDSMPLWIHYGLFPKRESGMETILGAAKYDISMLMTYVSANQYLRRGGRLGFVLSQSLFKTSAAGQGFRRFQLPGKTPFAPVVVEDMVELKPFEGAANRTAVGVFVKGREVKYPVSYQYWKRRGRGRWSAIGFDTPYEEVTTEKITYLDWQAEPVESSDSTSAWITARPKALKALRRVLGSSHYGARAGIFTGGANAVYWLEVLGERPGGLLMIGNVTENARKKVSRTQAAVENELVYPLLRGVDVSRWLARPSISILLTHEEGKRLKAIPETRMQRDYPKAFSYLQRFETMLRQRAAFKRYFKSDAPFYSIFDIGDYSFVPWKVVWPWISERVRGAVVGKARGKVVVPEHNTSFVPFESRVEADYFCGLFNSAPCEAAIISSYGRGGGGIAAPSVLERVSIPKFSEKNNVHARIARLSEAAHEAAAKGAEAELKITEEDIDHWAAKLWGLSDEELAEIKRSLEET
jgi:SAM-dependent methyltransferase